MKTLDALRRHVLSFVHALLGEISFSWRPPQWLRRFGQGIARRPFFSLLVLLGMGGVLLSGSVFWNGWKHRPQPLETDWIIQAPAVADPSDEPEPQNLSISFDRSVAELAQIDKPSVPGVTMSPLLAGNWRWSGGSTLIFEPKSEWPAGTEYRITLARALFSKHELLSTLTKTFRTPLFTGQIDDLKFYINPKDPGTKQITATLIFSHPVDRASLEASLQLQPQGSEALIPANGPRFSLSYAKRDRIAYLRSANITLPKESTYVQLVLPDSVKTTSGAAALPEQVSQEVTVSSLFDLFQVNSAQVVIVKDHEGEPEQALILNTSVGIKPEVLAGGLHAYVLPKRTSKETGDPEPYTGPAEIDPKVFAKATPVKLTPIASEETYSSALSFHVKVPEKSQIYIQVDKGIKSLGDFPLGDTYTAISNVPVFEREVKLMNDGSLLALNGERKLSVSSRGVDELEYRLARVNPGEINHLVSQSEGSFQSPIFNSDNFNENDLAELTVRREAIAATDVAQRNYSVFDFSDFVKDSDANEGKLGLFILHLYGRRTGGDSGYFQQNGDVLKDSDLADRKNDNGEKTRPEDIDSLLSDRRLILVTDLGLLVKDNADGTHDVFVQSIKTGGPVEGARVQVLGKNGLPLVSVETNDQGRAPWCACI
jgi:hypothetical protein